MKLKSVIRAFLPPVIFSIARRLRKPNHATEATVQGMFSGNFRSYSDALSLAQGYSDDKILSKVKESMLQVKNGSAKYERDSVLFDKIEYAWPLLAIFQNIALKKDARLSVLDFGGSLGSSFYQNIHFLSDLKSLTWIVVEQQNFVDVGKAQFQDNHLKFVYTIDEALELTKPDVVLFSGVLQYLEQPYKTLADIFNFEVPYILIDRTSFVNSGEDRITIQNVPESIYKASYPCTFFNESKFLQSFSPKYDLVTDFDSFAEIESFLEDGVRVFWKGFLFKRKS